ncbi:hypothetical protein QE390_000687 [Siphonobacter sp. SORGH_AS 1065]|nr:hypothetical protein [Siphonobacter sp. SORGH_AS_1065]
MVILPIDRSGEDVLCPPTKNVEFFWQASLPAFSYSIPNGRASLGIGTKFPVLDTLNFEKEELKDYLST